MRDSHDEFVQHEIDSWRESGQALADSKDTLAYQFRQDLSTPEWAMDAIASVRDDAKESGTDIPYTNDQLLDAISLDYTSDRGDGTEDPEITFDDAKLQEPKGFDPAQGTLPGIEPEDPSKRLTDAMREELSTALTKAFNDKAESDADDVEPPQYVIDNVREYQEEYWDSTDDADGLRVAADHGMNEVAFERDDDEEPDQAEMELPEDKPTTPEDPVLEAVRSSDPKSIWKVADSPRGKQLLLGTGWSGVLNLKDPESMARFNKYVGKAA